MDISRVLKDLVAGTNTAVKGATETALTEATASGDVNIEVRQSAGSVKVANPAGDGVTVLFHSAGKAAPRNPPPASPPVTATEPPKGDEGKGGGSKGGDKGPGGK